MKFAEVLGFKFSWLQISYYSSGFLLVDLISNWVSFWIQLGEFKGFKFDSLMSIFQLWEMKMMHAGAILGTTERNPAPKGTPGGPITTPVHDLNVPYEGTEEYETPTADILFPPVSTRFY